MAQAYNSDKAFIVELYNNYYSLMKRKSYEICNDLLLAEDMVHEAFLKLSEKIDTLRKLDCCKTASYVVYTVKNVTINHIKKRSNKFHSAAYIYDENVWESITDLTPQPEELYIKTEELQQLGIAVSKLSENDRDLLYYKYNLELSDKEIASVMGMPEKNVRTYVMRARNRLRKFIYKENFYGQG